VIRNEIKRLHKSAINISQQGLYKNYTMQQFIWWTGCHWVLRKTCRWH